MIEASAIDLDPLAWHQQLAQRNGGISLEKLPGVMQEQATRDYHLSAQMIEEAGLLYELLD